MSKPSDIITIALAEVGYREKASNASLDAPQANTGSGNWTKFARDLPAASYYNGNKNGFASCDVFVDWCFYTAFGAEDGQRIQCQTRDLGAACIYSAQYYMMQGRYDQTPRPGDQVFFNVNGLIGHTGIVVEDSDSHVIVVEGNSGNRVQKLTYNRKSAIIAGYGHPKYDEMDTAVIGKPSDTVTPKESASDEGPFLQPPTFPEATETIRLPLLKKGTVSNAVKNAQTLLIRYGYA